MSGTPDPLTVADDVDVTALRRALGGGLLGNAALSMVVWSGDLEIVAINPAAAALMGRPPAELVGLAVDTALPSAADSLREVVTDVFTSGRTRSEHVVALAAPDGSQHERLLTAFPVELAGTRIVAALSMDLTRQKVLVAEGVERLDQATREAHGARAEYDRALLDYTQLVRHRIANPLTAVLGGIRTLLDLDLSAAVRRQLLESMLECAERLEQVALHPESVGPEEHELDALPSEDRSRAVDAAMQRAAGDVEADFRDLNRRQIIEQHPTGGSTLRFTCECSAPTCTQQISMVLDDYYRTHRDAASFVIVPGHEVPAIEDVAERADGYLVVRKRGKAAERARER